eukprot:5075045-Pleurochrysis_carterae.AAC.1
MKPVIIPSGASSCSLAAILSAIMFGTIPTCDSVHMKMTVPQSSLTFVMASRTAPFCILLPDRESDIIKTLAFALPK